MSFWLACACAPALAACSLLLGEGFTDPNADPPKDNDATTTPDAQTDGGDGSNPQLEAGPGTDGSPSNDDASDGASSFVCPMATVSFCDDFQRDAPQGNWDSVFINAGGTLVIGKPSVGSRRLESAVTAESGQAQMMKAFGTTPKKVHFELMLQVSALPQTGGIYIGGIAMPNGSAAPSLIYLYVNQAGAFFVEQVADGGGYVSSPLALTTGAFHHVVVDLQFSGNATVTVDGASKVVKVAESFLVPKPMEVYLGGSSIDGVGKGVSVFVDDFVFTAD